MRVSEQPPKVSGIGTDMGYRIVEYATKDQAQNAIATLSNQNLMGRLVYVREVCALQIIASKEMRYLIMYG